jgi:hypothetical protein
MWERDDEMQAVIKKSWLRKNPGSDLGVVGAESSPDTN